VPHTQRAWRGGAERAQCPLHGAFFLPMQTPKAPTYLAKVDPLLGETCCPSADPMQWRRPLSSCTSPCAQQVGLSLFPAREAAYLIRRTHRQAHPLGGNALPFVIPPWNRVPAAGVRRWPCICRRPCLQCRKMTLFGQQSGCRQTAVLAFRCKDRTVPSKCRHPAPTRHNIIANVWVDHWR
jgi:hypothetical protein